MKKKAATKRKVIRGKQWKKSTSMVADKYKAVSKVILKFLTKKPVQWGYVCDAVGAGVPKGFDGSVQWYTTACLRELESQGKIIRKLGSPVLYSKK